MPQGTYEGNSGSNYKDYQSRVSIENVEMTRPNVVTCSHDLGQSTFVPETIPHRQIKHAEPAIISNKNTNNREKIQKFKANRVNPVISINGPLGGDKREYDEDGQYNQRATRDKVYDPENNPTNEDDEYLTSGQLKMYRTRSYNSDLSFERDGDANEKRNNLDDHGNGYSSPIFRADPELEQKILRKLDRNLLPLLGILYLFSYLDRVNIGNARLFGLEDDIKMTDGQYNIALASFFLAYCVFELPSNMVLVRLGPRVWIPVIMVIWGSISLGLAWITSYKGLVIARFALGAAEAGFVPGVLFYLTLFYKRSEHSFRIAIFLCFNILAGAFGGLLAAGISHLSGKLGLQGWQWIFIAEAIPTILLAVLTRIIMSPSPEKASFLSPEERIYATNRILADTDIRPTPQASWKQTKSALTDPRVYMICLACFFIHISTSGVIMFMPSLIAGMGFKATTAQLLTTPVYFVAAIVSLFIPWWSDRIQVRGKFVILVPFVSILGFIMLALSHSTWLKYLGTMMALSGMVPTGTVLTSWLTNNVIGHTKRATALAMFVSSGSLGSMVGTQVYRSSDAPSYRHGHLIMAGSALAVVLVGAILRFTLAKENRRRDRNKSKGLTLIQFMSDGQFSEVGDHPNFRYTL